MSDSPQGIPAAASDAAPQATSEQPQISTPVAADPKLDMYARKERQLLKMRKEFEAQKQAWEAEKANYLPKNRFKEDPMGALADVDLDYQKLTETVLNQPNINDPTIRALQGRIKAMEEAEVRRNSQAQEAQQQQYEQAKKQMLTDVKLSTNGVADYELIEKWGAHDSVVELIEETFNKEGYVMDTAAACKAVEEHLLNEAMKVYESAKLKDRMKPKEPVPGAPKAAADTVVTPRAQSREPQITSSARNQVNTLTNRMSQEAPKRTSEKERIARALAAFKGELK